MEDDVRLDQVRVEDHSVYTDGLAAAERNFLIMIRERTMLLSSN